MHLEQKYYPNRLSGCATIAIAAVLVLAACNNNKTGDKNTADSASANGYTLPQDDSLQLIHDIDSADYASVFKNKTNTWLGGVLGNTQTTWANFKLIDYWRDDSLKQSAFKPAKKFYTDYAAYLKWSPDSSYIFDMGSYGVTVVKDKSGNTSVESGDIDNEAALLQPSSGIKTRLLFFGPSGRPVNAHWLDSSQVVLVGLMDTSGNHHPDTLMWLIDVKEKFFRKYAYHR